MVLPQATHEAGRKRAVHPPWAATMVMSGMSSAGRYRAGPGRRILAKAPRGLSAGTALIWLCSVRSGVSIILVCTRPALRAVAPTRNKRGFSALLLALAGAGPDRCPLQVLRRNFLFAGTRAASGSSEGLAMAAVSMFAIRRPKQGCSGRYCSVCLDALLISGIPLWHSQHAPFKNALSAAWHRTSLALNRTMKT